MEYLALGVRARHNGIEPFSAECFGCAEGGLISADSTSKLMPRTVLVVDDERDNNDVLSSLVQARGLDPVQVFSGAQAIAAVAERRPDLILLAPTLPDMDGFDLCDRFKRSRETNLIPIVMVTAQADAHKRASGVRVGANGYLVKPFTPAKLHEAMDEALAWHEEHQQKGTTGEIHFDIRSELTFLAEANDMLADLFAHTPLTERQIKDLKQAIMEMGGNAIEWGHRKNTDLVLRITYRIDPKAVTLIIQDEGPGFNPRQLPHAASEEDPIGHIEIRNELGLREGGFGIMLARGMVDRFHYNSRGNVVTMIKYIDPPPAE